ncbi:MAG: hypothetical protein NTY37_06465 [Methanothrix sp.]|nr:hypothetical protein [Methanothrix sp.]
MTFPLTVAGPLVAGGRRAAHRAWAPGGARVRAQEARLGLESGGACTRNVLLSGAGSGKRCFQLAVTIS